MIDDTNGDAGVSNRQAKPCLVHDTNLYRIQFYRGISSCIKRGAVMKCTVMYCNEFNYNVLSLTDSYDNHQLRIELVHKETSSIASRTISVYVITNTDDLKYSINIQFQFSLEFQAIASKATTVYLSEAVVSGM